MDMKRVTLRLKMPNPLFLRWLEELYDSAVDKKEKLLYERAMKSLRKYPLVLKSGAECAILNGFGRNLCNILDEKLVRHMGDLGRKFPILNQPKGIAKRNRTAHKISPNKTETYPITSQNVIIVKDNYLNVENKLDVYKENVGLTDKELGNINQCKNNLDEINNESNDELPNVYMSRCYNGDVNNEYEHDNESQQNVCLFLPNQFDIILLVDKQEISGKSKKEDETIMELEKHKMIKYELRHLKVGDFLWVARNILTNEEVVLPYIVERKRIDDLGNSIKDGRFHEQKFRLKQSAIPNVIYLLEFCKDIKHTGLPVSTLKQAATNTRIQDGFNVHFTTSLANSIKFLAMMTKNIADYYKDKTLSNSKLKSWKYISLDSFEDFNTMSVKSKTSTVSDMLLKQLLQLKGVTVEKALAITSKYSTPLNLMKAYEGKDTVTCENMLSKINYNNKIHTIGLSTSKLIYKYFTSEKLY